MDEVEKEDIVHWTLQTQFPHKVSFTEEELMSA